jgi:uncharacterized Ntn-hydrolase superfamily protein
LPNQNQPSEVALGNGLANERTIGAMMVALQAADDRSLAERLIIGLEAGFAAGAKPITAVGGDQYRPARRAVAADRSARGLF